MIVICMIFGLLCLVCGLSVMCVCYTCRICVLCGRVKCVSRECVKYQFDDMCVVCV